MAPVADTILNSPIHTVVIPAAGFGTRGLPGTKVTSKEMQIVDGKPIIDFAVREAAAAGAKKIVIVISPEKDDIKRFFSPHPKLEAALLKKDKTNEHAMITGTIPPGVEIVFALQEEPLGLGHAIYCAKEHVGDKPFGVILPDDLIMDKSPCLKQMADAYKGGNMAAAMDVPADKTSSYGILDIVSENGKIIKVRRLVEKPAPGTEPSRTSITGRYILDAEIMKELEKMTVGTGGEIQLTEAMNDIIEVVPFQGYRFDGERYDCGDTLGVLRANVAYSLANPEKHEAVLKIIEEFRAKEELSGPEKYSIRPSGKAISR